MWKVQITFGLLLLFSFVACDCDDSEDSKKEDEYTVKIEMVGSAIEGLTLCTTIDEASICKKTDSRGMVEFKEGKRFNIALNDMNLTTIEIEHNASVYSPFQLFSEERFAKKVLLLLHAFDKSEDITDEQVLLSFSKYIPNFASIKELIEKEENLTLISYEVNDHNVTIDWEDNTILRDSAEVAIVDVASKEAYYRLNSVARFVYLAEDKNVTMDNLETKYLLKRDSLTRFSLGEEYSLHAFAKDNDVIVELYNKKTRTTDELKLLDGEDNNTLRMDYLSLVFSEEE